MHHATKLFVLSTLFSVALADVKAIRQRLMLCRKSTTGSESNTAKTAPRNS
jgi:hypothetical protein